MGRNVVSLIISSDMKTVGDEKTLKCWLAVGPTVKGLGKD